MADLIYRRDAYDVVYKDHCGICTGAILDIPAVDAIPVEWLRGMAVERFEKPVLDLLWYWQREQEAR